MTAMIEDNTFIKLPNNRLTYTLDSEMRGLSMLLQKVAQGVQQIAEAIAATVNSNVTIVDSNLVRVAGTGPYQKKDPKLYSPWICLYQSTYQQRNYSY